MRKLSIGRFCMSTDRFVSMQLRRAVEGKCVVAPRKGKAVSLRVLGHPAAPAGLRSHELRRLPQCLADCLRSEQGEGADPITVDGLSELLFKGQVGHLSLLPVGCQDLEALICLFICACTASLGPGVSFLLDLHGASQRTLDGSGTVPTAQQACLRASPCCMQPRHHEL